MNEIFNIYLCSPKQPIEIVRILDGLIINSKIEKFSIRLVEGIEHIYTYCRLRRIRSRADGRRYVPICLKSQENLNTGFEFRSIFEDEECFTHLTGLLENGMIEQKILDEHVRE